MRTKTFTDEVYGSDLVLVWNTTPEQFRKFVQTRYDKNYDGDSDFVGRCIVVTKPTYTVLVCIPKWSRSPYGISVLVHELGHATENIMWFHDIDHCAETSEPWAYFLDSLVRRCLEALP